MLHDKEGLDVLRRVHSEPGSRVPGSSAPSFAHTTVPRGGRWLLLTDWPEDDTPNVCDDEEDCPGCFGLRMPL